MKLYYHSYYYENQFDVVGKGTRLEVEKLDYSLSALGRRPWQTTAENVAKKTAGTCPCIFQESRLTWKHQNKSIVNLQTSLLTMSEQHTILILVETKG